MHQAVNVLLNGQYGSGGTHRFEAMGDIDVDARAGWMALQKGEL